MTLLLLWPGLKLQENLRFAHLWKILRGERGCLSHFEALGQQDWLPRWKCKFSGPTLDGVDQKLFCFNQLSRRSRCLLKSENQWLGTKALSLFFSMISVLLSTEKHQTGICRHRLYFALLPSSPHPLLPPVDDADQCYRGNEGYLSISELLCHPVPIPVQSFDSNQIKIHYIYVYKDRFTKYKYILYHKHIKLQCICMLYIYIYPLQMYIYNE